MLKPITLKRFLSAVHKIEAYFSKSISIEKTDDPKQAKEYFFVKSGKVLRKLLLEDILYFEGEKEYVRLVSRQEQLLIYRRLKDIEEQLPLPFIRVHNSYIVNIRQLEKIQDNHLFVANKQIPVSDKFRDNFMSVINQRTF